VTNDELMLALVLVLMLVIGRRSEDGRQPPSREASIFAKSYDVTGRRAREQRAEGGR
jgi:hypothetical protein